MAAVQRKRRGAYTLECRQAAVELYIAGVAPSAIERQLKRRFPDEAPPLPTIKTWLRGVKPASDAPWDFLGSSVVEVKAVAPALNHAMDKAAGESGTGWPTQSEAEWMIRIAQLQPGWPAQRVYELGRYIAAMPDGSDERRWAVNDLVMLAGGPVSAERRHRLQAAGIAGGTAVPEANPYTYDPEGGR